MSYSTAGAQKFTMIDELPDLDDLEGAGPQPLQNAVNSQQIRHSRAGLPPGQEGKYAKFIRQGHPTPNEAGMSARSLRPMEIGAPQEVSAEAYEEPPSPAEDIKRYAMPEGTPSCLDVAEHIANCPICSKFYNDDKTIYIIAIIVLAVICVLLLKRVLDL